MMNTAVPSSNQTTDPSPQREVDDGRPRIPPTPSPPWLPESPGRRGANPPQTLGHAPPGSGQLNGAARIEARTRQRAIRPRHRGCWAALHLSPVRLGGSLDLLQEDEGERLGQ